jgi:hypothetical protein
MRACRLAEAEALSRPDTGFHSRSLLSKLAENTGR